MNSIKKDNYYPSFQSYYKSAFSKKLERVLQTGEGKEEIADDFAKFIKKKRFILEKKIGSGQYGSVYRIDDYYVFKIYHTYIPRIAPLQVNESTNIFQALKTYCGRTVAMLGNIEIKRNVTKDKNKFVQLNSARTNYEDQYNHSLAEFSSLPQRAFDNLAKDFSILNTIHSNSLFRKFDTNNPNNFIKVGKSIKIVDDIDFVSSKNPNDFFSLLKLFIRKDGNTDLKKEIFKKCIIASEKNKLPMDFCYKFIPKVMDDLFHNADAKDSFTNFYQKMNEFRGQKNHMQLVQEYLENI